MTRFDQRYQHVETQYNADQITIQQQPLSLTEKQRKQNRTRMLDRVQTIWIKGVLEPSVQGTAQIALELEHKPSAIVTPLWQEVRAFDTTGRLSSAESSIVQVYDHANGEVLILGEPGAGKTTLLLELTRALLERARQEETHPIPVVFSLSSWATRRQPLTEWLASELHTRYQVPLPVAASWIETDQVLPLLDGLDEVAASHRAACVEAINTYRQAHGLLPTVVCSRQTDYLVLSTHLLLRTAVVVQPLTPKQIETYLESVGKQAEVLRTALHQDADLRELATTPLMLTILLFAYKGISPDKISELTSLGAKREQIFASYAQHMLKRRGASKRYQPEQITHWLTSLARQMRGHGQTIFYLEHLQPDWLEASQQRTYVWRAIRLPAIVIGILMSILVQLFFSGGIVSVNDDVPSLLQFGGADLLPLLQFGVLGGLLGWLWHGPVEDLESGQEHRGVWRKRLIKRLTISTCIGLIYGLSFGFHPPPYTLRSWLIDGLPSGVMVGLSSLLLQYLLARPFYSGTSSGASATRRWGWVVRSWSAVQGSRALLVAVITGLSFGLSYELSYGLSYSSDLAPSWLDYWVSYFLLNWGVSYGLSYGLSYALLSLTLSTQMGDIHLTERIRWTWRSLRRGLFNSRHLRSTVLLICTIQIFLVLGYLLSNTLNFGLSVLNFGLRGGLNVAPEILISELGVGWLSVALQSLISGLRDGSSGGLSVALSYWFVLGLLQGIAQERIEDQDRRTANQGIHRSLRNSVMMGIISGVIIGSIGILCYGLNDGLFAALAEEINTPLRSRLSYGLRVALSGGLSYGLSVGLLTGICGALLIGILTGGLTNFRHYIIRFLLWRSRTFPWKVPQFLDDATTRILLRRVGGGYSFMHRLILDYFADREARSAFAEVTEHGQQAVVPTHMPSSMQSLPNIRDRLADLPTSLLSPVSLRDTRLLPCGHKRHSNARFCSVCGVPIPP